MSKKRCIVELEKGVWLAPWHGDPGRTLIKERAQQFMTRSQAKRALRRAREQREFKDAKIHLINPNTNE